MDTINSYDAARMKRVFQRNSSRQKLFMLLYIESNWIGWDVFPIQSIVRGLFDADPQVRTRTVEVICQGGKFVSREVVLDVFRLVEDVNPFVREAVVENFHRLREQIRPSELIKILQYLVHHESVVRDSATRAIDQIEHLITEELMTVVVNLYQEEQNLEIKNSIGEFLVMKVNEYLID
mgnify:CR=1 FL=1